MLPPQIVSVVECYSFPCAVRACRGCHCLLDVLIWQQTTRTTGVRFMRVRFHLLYAQLFSNNSANVFAVPKITHALSKTREKFRHTCKLILNRVFATNLERVAVRLQGEAISISRGMEFVPHCWCINAAPTCVLPSLVPELRQVLASKTTVHAREPKLGDAASDDPLLCITGGRSVGGCVEFATHCAFWALPTFHIDFC